LKTITTMTNRHCCW